MSLSQLKLRLGQLGILMDYPGEKLLVRLWETIAEKGVGGLLSPWQSRREGRALRDVRREDLLSLAQAERDAQEIQSGLKTLTAGGQLVDQRKLTSPLASGEDSACQQALGVADRNRHARDVRAEVNVSKALLSAEAELEVDPQSSPETRVDEDWLFRWRDAASTVSSEELQSLWGRVLAGEVKSPGAFPLRTLDFLKNLSQEEALQISKLSQFVVSGGIVRSDKELSESEGLPFSVLSDLQQIGIIAGVDAIGLTVTMGSEKKDTFFRALPSHDRALIVTHEDASKTIELPIYRLTSLGAQILALGSFKAHENYLRGVERSISDQGFKVRIADYVQVGERGGRYSNARELDA